MEKSERDNKKRNMDRFLSKIDNNTSVDYKTKRISDTFEGEFVAYKSEKDKKSSITNTLKKLDCINIIQLMILKTR